MSKDKCEESFHNFFKDFRKLVKSHKVVLNSINLCREELDRALETINELHIENEELKEKFIGEDKVRESCVL